MQLWHIALNNLRRRKARMLLMLLGLAVGIATIVSVIGVVEGMKGEMTRQLSEFGANVVITADTGELTFSYGGIVLPEVLFDVEPLDMQSLAAIDSIPSRAMLRAVAPKLLGPASASGQNVVVVGTLLQEEFKVKPWLRLQAAGDGMMTDQGKEAPAGQGAGSEMEYEALDLERQDLTQLSLAENQVIAGAAAALRLDIRPGDLLELSGKTFEVFALLKENGSAEDEQILMDLSAAQTLLGRPDELTVIELAADYTLGSEETLLAELGAALPRAEITSLRQEALRRDEMLTRLVRFGTFVSVLVLFVGILVSALTMSGSVRERTREIGIFRAIGFRKAHITVIIMLEGALVSLAGGVLGHVSGMLAARYAGPLLSGLEFSVPWRPGLFAAAVLLALATGIVACIFPARQAARLDPVEALRFI